MKVRFPLRSLYVLTDPNLSRGRSHEEVVREAIAGGAEVIQLRDKSASTRDLIWIGEVLREITRQLGAVFIVNDRVDVALAVDADGVHLGSDDMPIEHARRLMGDRIIGASVDDVQEAIRAVNEGADYVALGPIFPTSTKPDAGSVRGVGMIRRIKEAVNVPLVAIGGINLDNVSQVVEAGADSVAVISAVVAATDIRHAARALVERIKGVR
jgi:thiamine-phosphate diphosphorylase